MPYGFIWPIEDSITKINNSQLLKEVFILIRKMHIFHTACPSYRNNFLLKKTSDILKIPDVSI